MDPEARRVGWPIAACRAVTATFGDGSWQHAVQPRRNKFFFLRSLLFDDTHDEPSEIFARSGTGIFNWGLSSFFLQCNGSMAPAPGEMQRMPDRELVGKERGEKGITPLPTSGCNT